MWYLFFVYILLIYFFLVYFREIGDLDQGIVNKLFFLGWAFLTAWTVSQTYGKSTKEKILSIWRFLIILLVVGFLLYFGTGGCRDSLGCVITLAFLAIIPPLALIILMFASHFVIKIYEERSTSRDIPQKSLIPILIPLILVLGIAYYYLPVYFDFPGHRWLWIFN